ncbi:uncharacterized protein Dwil_GK25165 [Drosophila willistoni]|uniref:Uncharacterized protein n=1 Tax=Drosophila willistoni TaxID=7260 RepID=B4NC04_DROWI|nr:uncharacterized protein LOC6649223 [Drosophila willistoni]EDW82363.1 uncharacterized protein Dwil_GK25165 [Drosophila willistoni]
MTTGDSDSDSQDEAQMRQFLEAADHTLLNNAMFQPNTNSSIETVPTQPQLKSERYLEHEATAGEHDLKFSEEMRTHFWKKLSQIIRNQVEFCQIKTSGQTEEIPIPGCVQLVSNAKCYLNTEIVEPTGPLKKPIIKKRRLSEEAATEDDAIVLAACTVSGQEVLDSKDTMYWTERKPHPNKFFQYKSNKKINGQELLKAVEVVPTNEFTLQRLKNKWDESKISQKRRIYNKKN